MVKGGAAKQGQAALPTATDSCNLCGKPAASRCSACGVVVYCCKEHQKTDWKAHKNACSQFQSMKRAGQAWEGDVKQDEYSGTFRWSQKRDFVQLPQLTKASVPCLDSGWQDYFATRLGDNGEDRVVLDVAMMDGLSFPMSFLFALRSLLESNAAIKDWLFGGVRKLTLVAVGCAERAEEHVLRYTNYFDEISNMLPSFQLQLWLVGPEMSAQGHLSSRELGPRMQAHCFRGTLAAFVAEKKLLMQGSPDKTIVVGYNTGMASGDAALQRSWEADIQQLLQHRVLTIFTCANDHTDLKCEKALMSKLGARYVLAPLKNVFSAITTLHPPGQQETGWYSANAFIYAVQGLVADGIPAKAPGSGQPSPPTPKSSALASSGQAAAEQQPSSFQADAGAAPSPGAAAGSGPPPPAGPPRQQGPKGEQADEPGPVPVDPVEGAASDIGDLYLPD